MRTIEEIKSFWRKSKRNISSSGENGKNSAMNPVVSSENSDVDLKVSPDKNAAVDLDVSSNENMEVNLRSSRHTFCQIEGQMFVNSRPKSPSSFGAKKFTWTNNYLLTICQEMLYGLTQMKYYAKRKWFDAIEIRGRRRRKSK